MLSLDAALILRLAESCNKPAEEVKAALRDIDDSNIRQSVIRHYKTMTAEQETKQ